jgi:hypothetical protein
MDDEVRHLTNPSEGKVIPVLNKLSTTPGRCMREWMYSSIVFGLGTTWKLAVSFRPCLFTPEGRTTCTHWIGGWVVPRAGLH